MDVSKLSLGKTLAEGLRVAIEECQVCIFLATARSLESRWCLCGAGAFWGQEKVFIYLADPEINESDLPPQFRGNLWTVDAMQLVEAVKETDTGPVRKTNGYCTSLGAMTINVSLGRIEEAECDEECLIALPANEFFDDDCIHDSRSALGAFIQYHSEENISDIQALVRNALVKVPSKNGKETWRSCI